MGEVCERAEVALPSWSRAKSRGRISTTLIKKIEDALTALEQEGADGQPAGE